MAFWDNWFTRSAAREYIARLDNPSTSWIDWLMGTTDAYDVAYTNPIASRCADMIGQAVAQLPVEIYTKAKSAKGEAKLIENHPLLDILNSRANAEDSAAQFKYAIAAMMATYGQAYLRGIKVTAGLSEVYAYAPNGWEPKRDKNTGMLLGYEFKRDNGGPLFFEIGPNGWCEIKRIIRQRPNKRDSAASPVEMAGKSIEENNSLRSYSKAQFEHQGRRPAVILTDKDTTIDPDSIAEQKRALSRQFKDDDTKRLPTFLNGAVTYQELGASSSDMQALEVRDGTAREICWDMGVPPVLLGIAGDSTFNNQAEARASFARDTIRPLCNFMAIELTAWLQPVAPGIEVRFNYSDDAASMFDEGVRWERVAKATGLTINEKRGLQGFTSVEDIKGKGDGDVVFIDGTQLPLSEAVTPVLVEPAPAIPPVNEVPK